MNKKRKKIIEMGLAARALMASPSLDTVKQYPILKKKEMLSFLRTLERKLSAQGQGQFAALCRTRGKQLSRGHLEGFEIVFGPSEATVEGLLQSATESQGRYAETGRCEDLDDAAKKLRQAVLHPGMERHPFRFTALADYGGVLFTIFCLKGSFENLVLAVEILRKADSDLRLFEVSTDARVSLYNNLGSALYKKYLWEGLSEDLDNSISYYRSARALAEDDIKDRIDANLGAALSKRFDVSGDIKDLDEAIALLEAAVGGKLVNLGNALCRRYEMTGALCDLEVAITHLEEALVSECDSGEMDRSALLSSLGAALHDRFDVARDISDLNRGIELLRSSIGILPDMSRVRIPKYVNLSSMLHERFKLRSAGEDLEEAIRYLRIAQQLMTDGWSERPSLLMNLQVALVSLFELKKDEKYLEEAIELTEEALAMVSGEGSVRELKILLSYGCILLRANQASLGSIDLEKARRVFEEVSLAGSETAPFDTLVAARKWADREFCEGNWKGVVSAGSIGLRCVENLMTSQLLRRHKEAWLRHGQGVAAAVAYSLARLGDLSSALEVIESGQARLHSEALELRRRDLERLSDLDRGDLYEDLRRVVVRIASASDMSSTETQRAAKKELEALVGRIRNIPGYENFGKQLSFTEISRYAKQSGIVYLIVTRVGGAALFVGEDGPRSVWLDLLTFEALRIELLGPGNNKREGYLRIYSEWKNGNVDAFGRWLDQIDRTTAWIYDVIIGPISEVIIGQSELVVVPCGLLSLLPIHAAWVEDLSMPSKRCYLIDSKSIRFVPNVRSLISARKSVSKLENRKVLAIQEPLPVSASRLAWASLEVGFVRAMLGAEEVCVLSGAGAKASVTVAKMKDCNWFHFAGHACADLVNPLESYFLFANDERLRLKELLEVNELEIRLAVLSACETALSGTGLADEAVGFPMALTQAGVGGIVASLWSVEDASTALLMMRFYLLWREKGISPALALRSAQCWLRDASRADLLCWCDGISGFLGGLTVSVQIPNSERPYAHPFYWAAFSYTGV